MLNDIKHRNPLELSAWLIGIIESTEMNLRGEFSYGIDDFCIRFNTSHISKLAQRREKETVAAANVQNLSSRRQRFLYFLVPAIERF